MHINGRSNKQSIEQHGNPEGDSPGANANETEKGSNPVNTIGRNPRLARRSGFPLQVLLLPAVVVRAFRFNPLRGAKGSRFRPVTGKTHKRSLF
ncbi:MAG: hypothetical protein LBH90_05405, partial [Tannerella sp.]|jgi:hypothetical protein|nr:hypothetical protein [Tannerella sp.]